jgi:hypothetical protein
VGVLRTRGTSWVTVGVVAMLAAGAATLGAFEAPGSPTAVQRSDRPVASSSSSLDRRVVAVDDAATMLTVVPLPPAAKPDAAAPVPATSGPPQTPASPELIDLSAWWTAPGTTAAVNGWVRAHVPVGAALSGEGSLSTRGVTNYDYVVFGFRPKRPDLTLRTLLVTIAPDGADQVALRADAQVIWDPARSQPSLINPNTVSSITITGQPTQIGGTSGTGRSFAEVTAPSAIRRIVTLLNGLPVDNSGPHSCPAFTGLRFTMRFVARNGRALAELQGDQAQCGGLALVVDGERQPNVDDPGDVLITVVATELGTPLSGG